MSHMLICFNYPFVLSVFSYVLSYLCAEYPPQKGHSMQKIIMNNKILTVFKT